MSAITPTPAERNRKSNCGVLLMPTTANIFEGNNKKPAADTASSKVVNVITGFNNRAAPYNV